ncbi:MAG TPA: hypothetical protein VLB68_25335 [Pyrinomonadaceae bacterium]|nr:hypothetical protein [Pyrinomonadaceae bacterium]
MVHRIDEYGTASEANGWSTQKLIQGSSGRFARCTALLCRDAAIFK